MTPLPTVTLDPTKYNSVQIELMEEMLILLDNDDKPTGEGSKKDSSGARSPLHRAFSVFLFHPTTGKLLLQKRADEKITFPAMWTNTCCSHPLTSGGERDEEGQIGIRRAASRKLVHELGIPITYPLDDFAYLTRIHYYAPSDAVWAEHEIDYILFLTLDPALDPSPNEVSDTRWVSKAELEAFFADSTNAFTPWFKLIAQSFLYDWWDALLAARTNPDDKLDAKSLIPLVEQRQGEMGEILRM
ncbi:hypothetical protein RQP46_002750 [Phenoliferia psychrophenolica]